MCIYLLGVVWLFFHRVFLSQKNHYSYDVKRNGIDVNIRSLRSIFKNNCKKNSFWELLYNILLNKNLFENLKYF